MTTIFFGTSSYCLPIIYALHHDCGLKLIVTRPDKPLGRRKIMTASATKAWAERFKVAVITPETLKKDTDDRKKTAEIIRETRPDLSVVADYGLIIPEELFNLPRYGSLNVHFSKLPDLRGPSPVQNTLLRGDSEAWVTIFKLENTPELKIKMDSGPILWQKKYPIYLNDTTASLYERLFKEVARELPKICLDFINDKIRLVPQDHCRATYTKLLTKGDGFIEWQTLRSNDAENIYNRFRAMTPWPGLWTLRPAQDKPFSPAQDKPFSPAQDKPKRMIIRKCHVENGKLILEEIQFEGKKLEKFSPHGLKS